MSSFHDMPDIQKNRWKIFVSISLFTLMATIDGSIVNIALPTIAKNLNIHLNQSVWIVSSYVITICTLLILFGKIGDIVGKIKIFRIGVVIFVCGTFLAGLSQSIQSLIAARIIQAIGASMTMSTNLGIITEVFTAKNRGKALGVIGSIVSLGAITGPSIGGIIVDYLPWSYIFWINIPFGVLTIILGTKYLPKDISKTKSKIDITGFLLYTLFTVLFFGAVFVGQDIGFNKPVIWLFISISIISLIVFIKYELSASFPLLEFSIFKNNSSTIGLICSFIVFGANFFFAIIMPFYLQLSRGYSPSTAGLIMMVFPIVMAIAAPISGNLTTKIRAEKLASFGLLTITLVHAALFFTKIDTNIALFIIIVGFNGLGNAIFQPANNTIIMGSVEKRYLGFIGSLSALARNFGNIVGITFATTILFTAMSIKSNSHITTYVKDNDALFMFGMHAVFLFSLFFMSIAFCISFWQLKKTKIKQDAI